VPGGTFPTGGGGGGGGGGGTNPSGTGGTGGSLPSDTGGAGGTIGTYEGGWAIDGCKDGVNGTGHSEGDVAMNFTVMDQYGEDIELYAFCERTVLLVSSAEWCGPCRDEAPELAEWFDEYEEDGLMILTLLGEDMFGRAPDQDTLQGWASAFDIHHPVVQDDGWGVTGRYVPASFGIPTMHLIGPGGEIISTNSYFSESQIVNALP